ncbi:class I lanthipeptide [Taibaiella koreensis]|uniref:class I lanthipeptide n=1 Tax=Taibaiella koreensis TaxID=1268548 RepID=UPI000E5998D1|nr:class I lanthipeptide [Taibaiella koreensis]
MKKKPMALGRKLFLNKSTIGSLDAASQQLLAGGDLVEAPKPTTTVDWQRCTTIEVFRLSYEVQCPATQTGPCTGLYCITTGPTC